jgi:hypothetical protein
MPIYINDTSVYPMELTAMYHGGRTVYNRATRGKSWFYLELLMPSQPFMTADGYVFGTNDGLIFNVLEE